MRATSRRRETGAPRLRNGRGSSKTFSSGCGGIWCQPTMRARGSFALVATGGFGRGWLFPYSDIDLLFLYADRRGEEAHKEAIRRFSQELWDLKLKLSPASRTLAECDRFDPNNTEFTISLLDCRYLAGDRELFARLHDKVIPKLVMREAKPLLQGLAEVTRERHGKFGQTVFHLEPNLKETPGGLRDYNVACWLALISAMGKLGDWPRRQFAAGAGAEATGCGAGVSDGDAMFSAFPPRARRQRAELGGAGRSGGAEDWGFGCSGADGCGLDADLLWACPRGATHRDAVAGGDSGGVVFVAAAISGMAVAAVESRLFRGGWADFSAAVFFAARSRDAAAAVSLYGASRAEVECDHGAPHRAGTSGAGGDSAARGGTLALPAGNAAAAACRGGAAGHAFAAPAHLAAAGTEAHRFAGGAGFLSSLHGGRALDPRD